MKQIWTVAVDPSVLDRLSVDPRKLYTLRFGVRSLLIRLQVDHRLGPSEWGLPYAVRAALLVDPGLDLRLVRPPGRTLVLGPFMGLLISDHKLALLQGGKRDTVYCRYAKAARQGGALLLFMTPGGIDLTEGTVTGYLHEGDGATGCSWRRVKVPLPRVIYDRCFGKEGRAAAIKLREAAGALGAVVVNRPPKITKMQAFAALRGYRNLARHLPYTAPLAKETLAAILATHDDLYLKPDALYKGQGVYRLQRREGAWELSEREEDGNFAIRLPVGDDLLGQIARLLPADLPYVVQEGIPLATYLGNRFDLRSLVQKDGRGRWRVSGVAARIAATGSAITSPRSGGQVVPAEEAFAHAFGKRSRAVMRELKRVSLAIAKAIDEQLGPCAELGLDLGLTEDGSVKLIEVNGIPLRVSLERLGDPLISERINRYPIEYAAYLDTLAVLPVSNRGRSGARKPRKRSSSVRRTRHSPGHHR